MRASATSRISSAHLSHAVQAHASAQGSAKTDEATPFAVLLASASPAKNDKSGRQDDAAHGDDKSQGNTKPTTQDTKTQAPAVAQVSVKADKPAKDDADLNKTDPVQDGAAPQPNADTPNADTQVAVQNAPIPPAIPFQVAQAQTSATGQDDGSDETAAPVGQAVTASAAGAAQASDAAKPQQDTAQPADAKPQPAKPEDIKSADAKPAPRKSAAADAQADTGKSDDIKAADARNAATAPAASDPAPFKPVQSQAHPDIAIAAAQPSSAAQSSAPLAVQHVQVTTIAEKPNLPALAVQIAARSQSGAKQFDIRLDPPELGRVEVRLSIDATGKASAHLSADQPQTLELLQKDSSSLTRALRDAGLDVAQDGLNFSLRQQNQQPGSDGGASRQPLRGSGFVATTSADASAATSSYRTVADGRLDIRV